ncbi:MAG: succinate dehydrogenase assembly factor 2 [Thiobacillus sp.]
MAGGDAGGCDRQADRVAWRCRRGLLELDLWLGGFWQAHRATLEPDERAAFERLLTVSDAEILDALQGRTPVDDAGFAVIIQRLQHFREAT